MAESRVAGPAPPLVLRLLGRFEGRVAGQPLPPLRTRKEQWLLALLVLRQGGELDRARLAATLWPDSPDSLGFYYLRRSLADLRRALGSQSPRLHAPAPRTLALDLTGADVDVLAFDAALARGAAEERRGERAAGEGVLPALERAVALYRGPLLEGCAEEWVLPERAVRERAYLDALEKLAAAALARGEAAAAERYLRQAVATDPLRESAQRGLMQTLAAGGNSTAAYLVYRELRSLLHRELNTEPDPETTALFQALRARARLPSPRPEPGQTITLTPPIRPTAPSGREPTVPCPALVHPDLPSSFPPPRSQTARSHNLPAQLTSFVGRERDMAAVRQHLVAAEATAGGAVRLLALTGTGGCGKTRLALQAASQLLDEFPDGVWLVELAALTDPALVPQAASQALGVREEPGRSVTATLADHLRAKSLLLLLDNCEHLLAACAPLADSLLRACPNLRILATSREGLGIAGEQTYRVPSLSIPGVQAFRRSGVEEDSPERLDARTPERLMQFEAVQLFSARAALSQSSFTVTEANAAAVAQVCRRLEGIPLAIELAAARVKVLPVETIAARLDDCFRLLTGGSRTALPRHQTLRATIDWSYDLLSEPEQTLLRRLSAFAGGWTLEAAEVVCVGDGVEEEEVLDLLTRLVEKSLVLYEERASEGRYRLLETVRQYARDRLLESGEREEVRGRHLAWFVELGEQAEPELEGAHQQEWLGRLEAEHDNLRAALDWGLEREPASALRLAAALGRFWSTVGSWSEGRATLERGLERGAEAPGEARCKALDWAGWLALLQGDHERAQALLEACLMLSRQLGARECIALALIDLGVMAAGRGDYPAARALYQECLALSRALGNQFRIAQLHHNLGAVALSEGDCASAREHLGKARVMSRAIGNPEMESYILMYLGWLAQHQGDDEAARTSFEESVALSRRIGGKRVLAMSLHGLGVVAREEGQYEAARRFLEESMAISRELGDKAGIAGSLNNLGWVARHQGDDEAAQALFEESRAIYQGSGDKQSIDRSLCCLVSVALSQGEYGSARALGGKPGDAPGAT